MNALDAFLKATGKSGCVSGVQATGHRNLKTPSGVPTKTRSCGGARGARPAAHPSINPGDPGSGAGTGCDATTQSPVTYFPRTRDRIVCTKFR